MRVCVCVTAYARSTCQRIYCIIDKSARWPEQCDWKVLSFVTTFHITQNQRHSAHSVRRRTAITFHLCPVSPYSITSKRGWASLVKAITVFRPLRSSTQTHQLNTFLWLKYCTKCTAPICFTLISISSWRFDVCSLRPILVWLIFPPNTLYRLYLQMLTH